MLNTWEGAIKYLAPEPADNSTIARLLGWVRADRNSERMNHIATTCANAHQLIAQGHIKREDLISIAVSNAEKIVTSAMTLMNRIDDDDQGIVSFANLSGDATLIVPSPRIGIDAYGHLAAFIRQAPSSQIDKLWRVIGSTVKSRIGKTPLWLSTAGGGVAWLHVRLDSYPKYYGYSPYTQIA